MRSVLKISNLNTTKDTKVLREIISKYEGIIACEISCTKKEIQIVYDNLSISLDEIANSIEMVGYMII